MKWKLLLIFCITFLILGCTKKDNITYLEDIKHETISDYTYKFIGESEHFYFRTGKAYYNNKERALLISNFKVKDSVNKKATFSINLYFNDKLLYGDITNSDKLSKDEFEKIVIGEHGELGDIDEFGEIIGESDSFLETTEYTFKDSIKLQAKYCISNNCEIEEFKIKYIEEEL